MAKKRPPGARRPGPTARRAEFAMDPASVMDRIEGAVDLAQVKTEHVYDLAGELRQYLERDWTITTEAGAVTLPENYSLFIAPCGMEGTAAARWSIISAYGLPDAFLGMVQDWLEGHPRYVDWHISALLEEYFVLNADEARPVGP